MTSHLIQVSVSNETKGSIQAIKNAFEDQGYKNMFSAFAVNSIIRYFEEKDWGTFLTSEKKTYTSAEINHDLMNDVLTGDEQWIKL